MPPLTRVAPRRGAWIETIQWTDTLIKYWSYPAGVRGLKHHQDEGEYIDGCVAPRRGAWIETPSSRRQRLNGHSSHPAGVRGLKLYLLLSSSPKARVAPRRGAWIETAQERATREVCSCRTPQGCVD